MESVIHKFNAMKKEKLQFLSDTQRKAKANIYLNTNNKNSFYSLMSSDGNKINIDKISNQIKEISSFILQCEYYYNNYQKNTDYFFNYFIGKFSSILRNSIVDNTKIILTKEQLTEIHTLIISVNNLVNNYKLNIENNKVDNKNINLVNDLINILSDINEHFNKLDELLKVDFEEEKNKLNFIMYCINQIKGLVNGNESINSRLTLVKVNKYIFVKESNVCRRLISKFYNSKNYMLVNKLKIYDIKFFFSVNEDKNKLKEYFAFIQNKIMKKYIMVNKISKFSMFKCVNFFGIGKSQKSILFKLNKFIKETVQYDCMIKVNVYNNLDLLMVKNFTKIKNESNINTANDNNESKPSMPLFSYNFEGNYIRKFLKN